MGVPVSFCMVNWVNSRFHVGGGIAMVFSKMKIAAILVACLWLPNGCAAPQPSWSKKLSAEKRFKLVLDQEAVLDMETGLVWERAPTESRTDWNLARSNCLAKVVARRKGWRLPTYEELTSLMDNTVLTPALPVGHPFQNIDGTGLYHYWTITDWSGDTVLTVSMHNFGALTGSSKTSQHYSWCVRGGVGYDGH